MQHLQHFDLFEARSSGTLSKRQEAFLDRYTQGTWSLNPATGLVDVQGSFDCSWRRLKSMYEIQFGTVTGDFNCYSNQLTDLAGAPQTVGGYFFCDHNRLTSLVGAPQQVESNFNCYSNQLTDLVGAPETVEGDFWCGNNQLTSLKGAPQTVGGYFWCDAFQLEPGEWNPKGWLQVLREGDSAARRLVLTLPIFDAQFWLGRLKGDLKQDGQTLLQLADLWGREGWEEEQARLQQELDPAQLRVIQALRGKLAYVDPWQDFNL
jgi:hypothetical protein